MAAEPAVYAFGPYVLDRSRRLLLREGSAVGLTPKAFDLLTVLVENDGQLVSKEMLMTTLWPDTAVEESNLTFQISTLRKVLGDGRYVVNVPGRGYQFAGPVERLTEGLMERSSETVFEDEESTTITVSDERRTLPWIPIAIAAIAIVAGIIITVVLLRRPAAQPAEQSGIRSIAVLPFRPIVASQRDESLELGMADTLITRLSHIPALVVRPTSAVRRYSALDQDSLAAGRDLGVDSVLEGNIHRSGDRMRVTVRLLRTSDGTPLWASQFDESLRDVFDVQDRVADGVARSIVPSLSGREQELLRKKSTSDLEAYDLYLQGLYLAELDPKRALDLFERAIARDPRFADAWAAIADLWLIRGRYTDSPPHEFFANARRAADQAIALDPELAHGHAARAAIYGDYEWRWSGAESEYLRALELNPNDATAQIGYAMLSVYRRKFDIALTHARRAVELDPKSPLVNVQYAMCLRFSGRHDDAIRNLEQTVRVYPQLTPALLHLGMAHTNAGHLEEGAKVLHDALALKHNASQLPALYAYAAAKAGHRDEALRVVHEVEELSKTKDVAAVNLALAWTALGDHDRAFAWLERAYDKHTFLLRLITVEQGFAPLRADPRYAELVRKMGL